VTEDRRERARQIYEMLQTPGWRIVDKFMQVRQERIASALRRDEFRDLLRVGRLQGEAEAYENIRRHIQQILRDAEREAEA